MVSSKARFSHFVGREAELAYLFRRLDTMCDGGGSAVLIVSPPGGGKSRLVREFRQRLGARAVTFALGGNLHRGQPPFSPFSEALGETFQASLFDRTSARVLVIEDLQWADDSTLELVGQVCRRIAELPMLLLLTLRTELIPDCELPPALAHLLPSLTHVLQLEPLSIADVRSLISNARDAYPTLSSEIARQIEQSCGGNPLYLEEQLGATLHPVDGAGISTLPELSAFQSSALRAFALLPPSTRKILTNAAILGLSFDSRVIAEITKQSEATIAKALQAAFEKRFVAPDACDVHRYVFTDPIIRNMLYVSLTPRLRAMMHGAAAAALEGRPASAARYGELSDQWYSSELPGRSVDYAERAAVVAEAAGDYPEAARLYERVLTFKRRPSRSRAEMCRKLANALLLGSSAERSRPYFEEAAAFYVANGASRTAASLLCSLAVAIWHQGDAAAALDVIERALVKFTENLHPVATARLLLTAADLCDLRGMFDRSRELLERAEALPCRKPRELQARYHSMHARALTRQRRLSEALTEYESALRLSNKLRNVKLVVSVSRNLSACLRLAGRFKEAEEQARAALEYARSHHSGELLECELALVLADLLSLRGKLPEATELLESVIEKRPKFGLIRLELLACLPIALAVDRQDLINACFEQSLVDAGLSGDAPIEKGRIVYAVSKLHYLRGEVKKARTVIRLALRSVESAEFTELLMLAVAEFGAYSDFQRARELLAVLQNDATPAFLALFDAFVAHRAAKAAQCQTLARRAARTFDRLGAPLLAARSFELAGDQRRALATYQQVGAIRDVKRLEKVFSLRGLKGSGALTRRQIEIGRHIAAGRGNRAIAQGLQISLKTLESHLTAIYDRLGVKSRSEIAAYVLDRNLR